MPRTPKAYGYCRLSKDEITVRCSACHQEWTLRIKNKEQTEFDCPFCNRTYRVEKRDPLSIQSQSDICRRIVEQKLPPEIARGLEIVADINVSGKMPVRKRPNGGELMQRLRPGDYLILPLLDRGFRNLADWCNQAEFFRRHKINLIIGDFPDIDINDPMGEMWLNLMAMFAQWYRQQVSRHTKRGLAKLKALGLPNSGKVPRGFALKCTACERIYSHAESAKGQACPGCKIPRKKNSIYVPHEGEQKLMWKLLWHRSAFCWKPWNDIVSELKSADIRTRTGKAVNQNWLRSYWRDAAELLYNEKLSVNYRPAFMENLSIHKIPNLPNHIAEKLEA